jgi:hypothetical protein
MDKLFFKLKRKQMNYLLSFIIVLLFNLYWFLVTSECKWSYYKELYDGSFNIYFSIGVWLYAVGGLICGSLFLISII